MRNSPRTRLAVIAGAVVVGLVVIGLLIYSFQVSLPDLFQTPEPQLGVEGNPADWLPSPEQLPAGLVLVDSRKYSNEDVAGKYNNAPEMLKMLQLWGRVSNFYQDYLAADFTETCAPAEGVVGMTMQAVLYKSSAGAGQAMEWSRERDAIRTNMDSQNDIQLGGASAFVNHYQGATIQCTSAENQTMEVDGLDLYFRRYNVIGIIYIYGASDVLDENGLEAMAARAARLIDDRIKDAAKNQAAQ